MVDGVSGSRQRCASRQFEADEPGHAAARARRFPLVPLFLRRRIPPARAVPSIFLGGQFCPGARRSTLGLSTISRACFIEAAATCRVSLELARLKTLLAENSPTRQTDKTDRSPIVSFVSDQGRHVSRDEAAIEERAGLAADRVPPVYLDAWARLNHQKPEGVSEAEWRRALDDGGRFLDAWGNELRAYC